MKRNKKKGYRVIVIIIAVILAIAMMVPGFSMFWDTGKDSGEEKTLKVDPKNQVITLAAVGDVMAHGPQLVAQLDSTTKKHDFNNNFQYIKPYIESVDFAMCNVETTFGGEPYSGYPLFNSPDTLATALKNAGFKLAFTSNNHMMDKGIAGVKRTIEILRENGMLVSGSRLEGEKNYVITDIKDIKTAFIGYTYRTPEVLGYKTINGNRLSEEAEKLVNSFGFEALDQDLEQLDSTIKDAKASGAELIVVYFHWGIEYQRNENEMQRYIAQKAADFGADIIFASHPHVEQPLSEVKSGKKTVPVFYSMGNFISNQREDTVSTRYAEQGAIARAAITMSGKKVKSIRADVVPTWVNKYRQGGKTIYTIVPLDGNLNTNPSIQASGNLKKAQQALADQVELFGQDNILQLEKAK